MQNKFKICPFPFARIESARLDAFIPCCKAWFKDEYLAMSGEKQNQWNSEMAKKLRESMYDGSYRYCHLDRCNKDLMTLEEIQAADPNYFETPIAIENIAAIEQGQVELPAGPTSFSLVADRKCNLECPTCRDQLIVKDYEYDTLSILREKAILKRYAKTLEVVKLANTGEVFFSKDQREILQAFNLQDFPNLKYIFIITNGLLFNQKTYDQLRPGTEFIKKVAISIDAGNPETYAICRGGDWHTLMRNLDWVSQMRKKGTFNTFNLNIVVRKANYQSIPELIELAEKLGVDRVEMTQFDDWKKWGVVVGIESYEEEAVHLKTHPEHQHFLDILRPYKDHPNMAINIEGSSSFF